MRLDAPAGRGVLLGLAIFVAMIQGSAYALSGPVPGRLGASVALHGRRVAREALSRGRNSMSGLARAGAAGLAGGGACTTRGSGARLRRLAMWAENPEGNRFLKIGKHTWDMSTGSPGDLLAKVRARPTAYPGRSCVLFARTQFFRRVQTKPGKKEAFLGIFDVALGFGMMFFLSHDRNVLRMIAGDITPWQCAVNMQHDLVESYKGYWRRSCAYTSEQLTAWGERNREEREKYQAMRAAKVRRSLFIFCNTHAGVSTVASFATWNRATEPFAAAASRGGAAKEGARHCQCSACATCVETRRTADLSEREHRQSLLDSKGEQSLGRAIQPRKPSRVSFIYTPARPNSILQQERHQAAAPAPLLEIYRNISVLTHHGIRLVRTPQISATSGHPPWGYANLVFALERLHRVTTLPQLRSKV